jgi:hypothetical protein
MTYFQKNRLLALLTICVVCIGIILFRLQVKRRANQLHYDQLENLALESSGFEAKAEAVEQLGHYDEEHANELLLKIAQDTDTNPSMRSIALSFLAKHHASVSKDIARLIIPQESLQIRQAATEALMEVGCPPECIRELLHYQERLFYGENTAEHMFEERTSDNVKQSVQGDAKKLNQEIRSLLQGNEQSTIDTLVREYGLGGIEPSKFACIKHSRCHRLLFVYFYNNLRMIEVVFQVNLTMIFHCCYVPQSTNIAQARIMDEHPSFDWAVRFSVPCSRFSVKSRI